MMTAVTTENCAVHHSQTSYDLQILRSLAIRESDRYGSLTDVQTLYM